MASEESVSRRFERPNGRQRGNTHKLLNGKFRGRDG